MPTTAIHTQEVRRRGVEGPELPPGSALCVTVPGAPALWEDTVKTFGKLSLEQVRRRGHRPPLLPRLGGADLERCRSLAYSVRVHWLQAPHPPSAAEVALLMALTSTSAGRCCSRPLNLLKTASRWHQ